MYTAGAENPARISDMKTISNQNGVLIYDTASGRSDKNRKKQSGWRVFLLTVTLGLFGIFFTALLTIISIYGYYQYTGLIVPGVRLGNLSLEGMSFTQASLAIHQAWQSGVGITVTNGSQAQVVTPADLGLSIDAIQTAQEAVDVGRGGSALAELAMMAVSMKDGWELQPQVLLDEDIARAGLLKLAEGMSLPPQNATIRLQGDELVPIPGQVGITIDLEQTLAVLKQNPASVIASLSLKTIPQYIQPEISDASEMLEQARVLLETPTRLYAFDPLTEEPFEWAVSRDEMADWLIVQPSENSVQVILDQDRVSQFMAEKSALLGEGRYLDAAKYAGMAAENIRLGRTGPIPVSHLPTQYIIKPGDTLLKIAWKLGFPSWTIVAANPGLNPDQLQVGSTLVIPSPDVLLPLPPIPNKRIVISIREQRMWIFQDGNQIKKFVISTGIDRSPTQPGIFQVQTHVRNAYASIWDLHMPNFLGIYEAWPGFMNGIHGLPTLSGGRQLWASILGKPASYGCIILNLNDATWLYDWAENGVVVAIRN